MSKPVIIGSGLAGLTTALALAPTPVIVLSAGQVGTQCSSAWAQGGIAAAMGDDDAPSLHAEDTIKAGAGLCNVDIVKLVTESGAATIEKLLSRGAPFDRDTKGKLLLGLEAAHSRHRIVHIGGDGAGLAIMQAIIAAARATPSIEIIENAFATNLLVEDNSITGVSFTRNGKNMSLATNRVVLATGGAGALWLHTTNPLGSWGCGLALAARAGAELADLEFMQFHPTAIDIGRDPMPLASEALRGEGAILVDEKGARFMQAYPRAELEPRDIVARAIWSHMTKGHRVFLDARAALGRHFAKRFPAIYAICMSAGFDPATAPIPVRPAAHYHMGGIAVDASGRSSVNGLWACGEVAATGLHGANRLASNSLLEAAFFGERVAEDVKEFGDQRFGTREFEPESATHAAGDFDTNIRTIMSEYVGVLRDGEGLQKAVQELAPMSLQSDKALVALMIANAALRREESRGSHARLDFQSLLPEARRQTITLDRVMSALPLAYEKTFSVGV
jgi:L-aspartate oxidase